MQRTSTANVQMRVQTNMQPSMQMINLMRGHNVTQWPKRTLEGTHIETSKINCYQFSMFVDF